ncbi:hypothetical protein [Piscinibacter sp.]|uniref:hypothetical protein n=1 Tax=Piscinibacter sp. TaxID=1903157 RepID=UPI001B412AB1|nr:hypothetical protein [Piscinibacter sp.]MBP5989707.1 hypothetical protein [Piscinibacter sp.]MBP6027867.1 hypothetical protein [Piscinibacter sp.]
MSARMRNQRLVALFAAGWALLNFPLLTLWDRPLTLAGIPLLPLALFVGWAVLIALAAWVAEAPEDEERS